LNALNGKLSAPAQKSSASPYDDPREQRTVTFKTKKSELGAKVTGAQLSRWLSHHHA
jgi:hypothetical protein